MKKDNLEKMIKGWFVGNFDPSVFKTNDVEVGVKKYFQGDFENTHYHKIATEITVIISGRACVNDIEYQAGDIITVLPYEAVCFKALENTVTVVVKMPGANNDKYLGEPND